MLKRSGIILLAVVLALCCSRLDWRGQASSKTEWEYKVTYIDVRSGAGVLLSYESQYEEQLNKLGAQGWELVNMEPTSHGNSGDAITRFICTFKRAKS